MLRYSRQLLCPFVGEVISLASLGRIVEKCSVNASGISDGVGNRSVRFFHRRDVLRGKFIDLCQVRQESFLCSLNDFL